MPDLIPSHITSHITLATPLTAAPAHVEALGLRLAEVAVAERRFPGRARALAACLAEGLGVEVALYRVRSTDGAPSLRLLAFATPMPTESGGRGASTSLRALATRAVSEGRLLLDGNAAHRGERGRGEAFGFVTCALPLGDVVIAIRGIAQEEQHSTNGDAGTVTLPASTANSLGATLARLAPVLHLALAQPESPSPKPSRATAQPRQQRQESAHDEQRQRLLALAAHDLRTPLNTLQGFLEIVHDEMVGPLNGKQRDFLGYARSSVQQVTLLFENVLTLSRGTRAPTLGPLTLAPLLAEAVHSLAPMAEAAQVTIHVEPASAEARDCPEVSVLAEREPLLHALRQVLANALLVTPAAGCVRAVVEPTSPGAAEVRCTIAETGAPITAEDAAALSAGKTSREHLIDGPRGAGSYRLRLAVARLEIERLGGTVTLAPTDDGLAVTIALPAAHT